MIMHPYAKSIKHDLDPTSPDRNSATGPASNSCS
jgi:hypothetical protein